jgi:hypothetical protein
MFPRMERPALATRIPPRRRLYRAVLLAALGMPMLAVSVTAQPAPRELRVEVRDQKGRRLPDARVDFPPASDSTFTDSTGVARITIEADSALTVSVRKIGYEPRAVRFPVGRTPAFIIRVTLGDLGQRLPEVSIVADYPGEPWRRAYEERKHRSSGSFRDRSYFVGREPQRLDDWFVGIPGAMMTSRGLRVNRCPRLGVWIDGMHVTQGGGSANTALMQLTATDIAALELYRLAQQQSQYSDPNLEDCSLLVWTRTR